MQTLIRFSQESRFRRCLDRVQGLIFFGTPNFTESNERAALILSGILRYETGLTGRWPSNITKPDLSSLVHSAYRFDELKLGCHIMTCFEKIPIKTRKFGVSRQIAVRYCFESTPLSCDLLMYWLVHRWWIETLL